jgi:hypothetical protein
MARKVLLVGGVLSSLLYLIGIDVIAALRYPDYHNYADQMVSELFAAGAPTRTLMVWLSNPYNVPVFALAVGVSCARTQRFRRPVYRHLIDPSTFEAKPATACGLDRSSLSTKRIVIGM